MISSPYAFILQNVAVLDLVDHNKSIASLQSAHNKKSIIFIETDVANKENVHRAFAKVVDKFRFIDIVIANAGILNEQDYEKTINVNLVMVILLF